jgi:CHAT domain-containing protein/tetratricopeptide (TPR) repeat protein
VAIIYSLTGEVFTTEPGQRRRAAKLLDLLPARAILESGPGSRASLAFTSGMRWELGDGGARITLGTTDLAQQSGDVRSLGKLPRLPRLKPIRKEDHAGNGIGAYIIRGEWIAGLYPAHGAAALADAAVLRFKPLGGTEKYRVEIEDLKGHVTFSTETAEPQVAVPARFLRPGTAYFWTVCTVNRLLSAGRGKARFRTLDAESAKRRDALHRAAKDPETTALLAGVDRQLGLLAEARDELAAVLRKNPENPAFRAALAAVERDLAEEDTVSPPERSAPGKPAEQGLVVEEVTPEGAAARAGIAQGDVLLDWERSPSPPANPLPASGRLESPFDLTATETEQAPRGAIQITGLRNGAVRVWQVPLGKWNLLASPLLSGRQLREYQRGRRSIRAGARTAGLRRWRRLAAEMTAQGDAERAAWLLLRAANIQETTGDRKGAVATYETILATVAEHCTSPANIEIRLRFAGLLIKTGGLERADVILREALENESLHQVALLNSLGRIALLRGDTQAAERRIAAALALAERLAPGSLMVSQELGNLGIIEHAFGKIAVAEDLQRRALEIDQRLLPESLDIALVLTNLAGLERSHRDFTAALEDYRKALVLRERLAPDSLALADALDNLGGVLTNLRDPEAIDLFQRSLALRKRLHASDLDQVDTLIGLGTAAWSQHQYALAERRLKQALTIQETSRAGTRTHAVTLSNLADVLLEEGRLAEAEKESRRALGIFRNKAPESEAEATAYRDLAVILRRAGKISEARELYEKSLSTLETTGRMLFGSGQKKSTFLAAYAAYYHEDVDLLVELGRPEEAFQVLERYRARGLLALLAERELSFGNEIPSELESERRSANTDYERVLGQFSKLSATSPKKDWAELQDRLTEARRTQDFVREKIRAASPRLAALRDPAPLDLAATSRALDPGTVLLSYMVGEERSYLFAVGPEAGHFAVFPIKAGQKALGEEVHRLRNLIEQNGEAARPQALLAAAGPLTGLLLTPAAREIAAAERLLVVPDGPLHVLPFAILADPAGSRFLIEKKPVHTAASATVFAELRNHREARPFRLAAFGDPAFPASRANPSSDPALRAAQRDGLRFDPLPGTRAEVEALGTLFPSQSRLFLGAEATEERAKALGTEPSIVHFASHALLNERFPLDSSLVLSIPEHAHEGQDNGLLQAWEIFEQVHLDADLVTLSACESALGKEQGGEGLIGLTRAFQYAGARSILASLWNVGDTGAAELMKRFYGYLKDGASKDEALRHAQADLVQGAGGSEWSSPFHWAAFELIGDWK